MTATAPEKTARVSKLTEEEQAVQARALIAQAHVSPRFDLAVEPWIPVVLRGSVELVGLRELFVNAHEISDVAVPNPLLRAALRRYLTALTADVVQSESRLDVDAWQQLHASNAGFTTPQVDALMARHAEHLWLWHPHTPFLQDMRLAPLLGKPQADLSIQGLVLHLPSGSSMAWWVKAGEPSLEGGIPEPNVALWLLARWFYASNGNCGDIRLDDTTTVGSQSGGAFAETVATVTHVFRVDGLSLFRTLLRGLPTTLSAAATQGGDPAMSGCAWLDPNQPRPSSAPLYQATLNPAAVLLAGRDDLGHVTRWLAASTPIAGEQAKVLRDLALTADQHRITTTTSKGTRATVRVKPGALRAEALRAFHRAGLEGQRLNGIANSEDCWLKTTGPVVNAERLDLLLVSKAGTGASPVWEEVTGLELPARHVDPSHPNPQAVEYVRAAVGIAFDPKDGIPQRIERAVGDLLAQPSSEGWKRPKRDNLQAEALTTAAVHAWLALTAAAFEEALDSLSHEAIEQWREIAFRTARDAFNEISRPYITSTRYAPRYAIALRNFNPRRPA